MLADPKSQRFVENFTGQWLDLREIDFTQPDENLYPEFDELLKLSMVEESHRFFAALLEEDLPLQNLIDADFTFLNQRLAEHYGIPGVPGQAFRKVTLPADSVRGGVLTQASLLKVTANGTTTSPVLRGAWVLERLLGQQVPPPPDNIPAVEPDIRGATTLREQLALHQQAASCAVCHRQIDPPGFALEHFDVIGRWRDRYRTLGEGDRPDYARDPHTYRWVRFRYGAPVDASGTTADGQAFRDIHDFKRLLLADERAIILSFTRQLATYALGRPLGFSDREELARLVDATIAPQAGLRSLLHRLVQSPLFRSP